MVSHKESLLREYLAYPLLYELRDAPLGRRRLVEQTGLTESVVRTELEKLAAQALVKFSKAGTALTPQGKRWLNARWKRLLSVKEVHLERLMLDRVGYAAHARALDLEMRPWLYRDHAVRAGATAVLFLAQRSAGLALADEPRPLARDNPADAKALQELFPELRPGDLLFIAFGPERGRALQGLWAILCVIL
jgi:predicted transcriptional regulator